MYFYNMSYPAYMQHKNNNSLILRKTLGEVYKNFRETVTDKTRSKLEDEFELAKYTINRVETAKFDCKIITLWKMAEAIGIKPSQIIKTVEEKLGEDFKLIDE